MWSFLTQWLERRRRTEKHEHELPAQLLRLHDEERRDLACELHDCTGQDLAALEISLVQLDNASGEQLNESGRQALSKSLALVRECSQQVRRLSYRLHPPLLDELGLDVALRDFAERFSHRTEIAVDVDIASDVGRMRPEVETALFRIVEACLDNVHCRSDSSRAELELVEDNGDIRLTVRDDGGQRQPTEQDADARVGIRGMRERMLQLGGRLAVESGPRGTTVEAAIPAASASRTL